MILMLLDRILVGRKAQIYMPTEETLRIPYIRLERRGMPGMFRTLCYVAIVVHS